jgi:polar amino acid transport system substrate-binding protein
MRHVAFYLCTLFVLLLCGSCSNIASEKIYRIGVDTSWYPLDLMGKEAAVFAFSNDLLNAIAEKEGLLVQLDTVSWDSLLYYVNQQKDDGALVSILPVLQYDDLYSFSDPYLMTGPVLVVRVDSTATSLADLSGKEIGVLSGSPIALLAEKDPTVIVRYIDKYPEALNQLALGRVDGVVIPFLLADSYIKNIYQDTLKISSKPLTDEGLRLITLKDMNQELMEAFNKGLATFQEDGTYEKLLRKWKL